MATSYANPLGSGDRRTLIRVLSAGGLINDAGDAGAFGQSVNGNLTQNVWFFNNTSLSSSIWIQFDLGCQVVVDEAKFYQELTTAQGTWKWQGSSDESTWTDIGTSFALGGVATQTLTALNGNTTAYQFYRIIGVSGSTSNSPWIRQFEFKVDVDPGPLSYANVQGSGDRTSLITVTASTGLIGGTAGHEVNGNISETDWFFNTALTAGAFVQFDFGTAIVIDEIRFYGNSAIVGQGTWQLQGSDDASAWTDIGSNFGLGAACIQRITVALGNTNAWQYYRLLGISGSTSDSPFLFEFEFRCGVVGANVNEAITLAVSQGIAFAAAVTLADGITLGLSSGITCAGGIAFIDQFTLAIQADITPAARINAQGAIALAIASGIGVASNINGHSAITLAVQAGITPATNAASAVSITLGLAGLDLAFRRFLDADLTIGLGLAIGDLEDGLAGATPGTFRPDGPSGPAGIFRAIDRGDATPAMFRPATDIGTPGRFKPTE